MEVDRGKTDVADIWQLYLSLSTEIADAVQRSAAQQANTQASTAQLSGALLTRASDALFGADTLAFACYLDGKMTARDFALFSQTLGLLRAWIDQARPLLSPEQAAGLDRLLATTEYRLLNRIYDRVLAAGVRSTDARLTAAPLDAKTWPTTFARTQQGLNELLKTQIGYAGRLSRDVADRQFKRSLIIGAILLVIGVGVVLVSTRAAIRMAGRLRQLRSATLALSQQHLPQIMTRLAAGESVDVARELPPMDFGSDEIGEVANAFDTMQQVAMAAAAREARLRISFQVAFVDVARQTQAISGRTQAISGRTQAIAQRELTMAGNAGHSQEDLEQLTQLFKLDHLATRVRRNAENLVLLVGGQTNQQQQQPISLAEVAGRAITEAEDYTRISFSPLPDVTVDGAAAADVIHLLAELVDNATSYSPPTARIDLRGHLVGRGVALELEDQGLGFNPDQLKQYNEVLQNPPKFDLTSLPDEPHLGMLVVARLAAHHGIRVSLVHSPTYGGTRVVILLPESILGRQHKSLFITGEAASTILGVAPRLGQHCDLDAAATTTTLPAPSPPPTVSTPGSLAPTLSNLALATILLGAFLSIADFFIVNVALNDIARTLHASTASLELVITGYGLPYALLLVAGGRLGDAFGRRKLFLIGMTAFIITSLACGISPNAATLVAMRIAQGASAALMVPQVLATVQATTTGTRRLQALSWFGAAAGLSAVVGMVVGGSLVTANLAGTAWRPIFLVNIPIGLIGLVLAYATMPDTRSAQPAQPDLAGTALLGLALVTLLIPLMEGRVYGWPAWVWYLLSASPVAFGAFILTERRIESRGGVPLVPLSLLRLPSLARGLLITLPLYAGFGGFMFVYTVMAQTGLRLAAVKAGLVISPMAVMLLAVSLAAPRLVRRLDRGVITLGAGIQIIGLLSVGTVVKVQWPNVSLIGIALSMAVAGIGQGMMASPLFGVVLSHVPPASAGAGSGVLSTTQQAALALGVATLGNLFLTRAVRPQDIGNAFAVTVATQAALALAIMALSRTLPRRSAQ
jgi:MFS family permease